VKKSIETEKSQFLDQQAVEERLVFRRGDLAFHWLVFFLAKIFSDQIIEVDLE
jgi:hypothetical protein